MKKIFVSILIILCCNITILFPQGFDWQYSARLPSDYPYFFLGISAEKSLYMNKGNFSLFEEATECCKFNGRNSDGFRIGLSSEYWHLGSNSIFAILSFSSIPANFTAVNSFPINSDTILITEFDLNTKFNTINLTTGYKYRLFDSYFFVSGILEFAFNISNNYEVYEKIISPKNFYFNTNPPSQIRSLSQGRINDFNLIIFSPGINIGYDLDLGKSYYATISLNLSHSLNKILKNDDWRITHLSIKLIVFRGILYR